MNVCIYPPCGKKRFSNGLCSTHFFRAYEREEMDGIVYGSRQEGWKLFGGLPDWFTCAGPRQKRMAKSKADGLAEDLARVGKHGTAPEGLAAARRVGEHVREGRPGPELRMLDDARVQKTVDDELREAVRKAVQTDPKALHYFEVLDGLEKAARKKGWLDEAG